MFKKELEVKPSANLKSSEKRKLQKAIETQYEGIRVPDKLSKAVFNSIGIKKGTLYLDSATGDPSFFQSRDGDIVPTLHTLWASVAGVDKPLCMPYILTHEGVIDRLIDGANLMIRGCHGPYVKGLKRNALVAVVDYKRPNIAVAIGRCLMDLEGKIDGDLGIPQSGVAVEIWTVIGDMLTNLGRNMEDVMKDAGKDNVIRNEQEDDKESQHEEQSKDQPDLELLEVTKPGTLVDVSHNLCDETEIETTESRPEKYTMTTEDIDEMFRRSVLYTLSQDALEFPIPSTQFMSGHVLKNLPNVDTDIVNMKKTSWKKTTKFLKAMEKEDLVKLKGKEDKLTIVSAAGRSDPRISAFVPYRIKKPAHHEPNTTYSHNDEQMAPVVVKRYYKPNNASRMFFNKLDEKYDSLYTEQDIKLLTQRYVKENPGVISKANAQLIEPDDVLKEFKIKTTIKRAELFARVMAAFSPYYAIYREGDEKSSDKLILKRLTPKKGELPIVKVAVNTLKTRKKVVTSIVGSEQYYIDVEKLAGVLRVKCSGSTTILDSKEPKDGKVVTVQGEHDSAVCEILHKQFGVPAKVITVTNNTANKKKRR